MEKKFRKGDRVRFIADDSMYQGESYCSVFIVTEDSDDNDTMVKRYLTEELCFDSDELELVESFDPKTAFLSELKELLTKYDAEIFAYQSDFEEVTLAFNIGDDAIEYGYGKDNNSIKITPSNIFDYDK